MAKQNDLASVEELSDEALLLKKRARRRLIGAIALALLAAVVLPLLMDHQPPPTMGDIQIRIPGKETPPPRSPLMPPTKSITPAAPVPQPKPDEAARPPASEPADSAKPVTAEVDDAPAAAKPEEKAAAPAKPPPAAEKELATETAKSTADKGKAAVEQWEVRLGAYQYVASVKNLVSKLNELDVPTYTEEVDTPKGKRIRVRAGPFASKAEAEQSLLLIRIIGVDGPVARKP